MLNYTQFTVESVRIPEIPYEKRSYKNIPRYSDGKSKVPFQKWLGLKGQGSKGYDGKYYGWSHRAVAGFKSGDKCNGDSMAHKDYDWDDSDNGVKHDSYTIQTDADAKEHSLRFAKAVS